MFRDLINFKSPLIIAVFIAIHSGGTYGQDTVSPAGYDIDVEYAVSGTQFSTEDTILVTRTILNNSAFEIVNLYLGDNLPPEFVIVSSSIEINSNPIAYHFSGSMPNNIINGYDGYHWIIDEPAENDTLNSTLFPGDNLTLSAKLICQVQGSYILPLHTTAFCGNPTCFFASGESLNITVAEFITEGALAGIVTDAESNSLDNVYVQILETDRDGYTNIDGEFLIDSISTGLHDIVFSLQDYFDTTLYGILIELSDTNEVSVEMTPFTGYYYLPGDAGMYYGNWPPRRITSDVTYMVNFFRSIDGILPCLYYNPGFSGGSPPGMLWASADFNGNCTVQSSDITSLVNYFKGIPGSMPKWCGYDQEDQSSFFPTFWPTTDDLPQSPPENWTSIPNEICENASLVGNVKIVPSR